MTNPGTSPNSPDTASRSRTMGIRGPVSVFFVAAALLALIATDFADAQSSRSRPTTGSRPAAKTKPVTDFEWFTLAPPKEWKAKAIGQVPFRKAAYTIPGADGAAGGEFVVTYFGPRGAGPMEANISRWKDMFAKPKGMSDSDHFKVTKQVVDTIPVTIVEVRGTYTDPFLGGAVPASKNHRMLAAIVETQGGSYYFKALAPEKTLEKWHKHWFKMVLKLKASEKQKAAAKKPRSQPKGQ